MTRPSAGLTYSFSMINLVKLMPEWSWDGFDQVMAQAGTNRVELVPSMLLGMHWDQCIADEKGTIRQSLERLMQQYTVASIQSLTYGLRINLADPLIDNPELLRRLKALRVLGKITGCSVLILGSPGQKKQLDPATSNDAHKQRFMENCGWMAHTLGHEVTLSLEHNTKTQGADYCNTLVDIVDVVQALRNSGITNVGINLDTKCLIHEFGEDIHVADLLANPELADLITSIQASHDFLTRDAPHGTQDHQELLAFAHRQDLPLSLEEFGLQQKQLKPFIDAWTSRV